MLPPDKTMPSFIYHRKKEDGRVIVEIRAQPGQQILFDKVGYAIQPVFTLALVSDLPINTRTSDINTKTMAMPNEFTNTLFNPSCMVLING